MISTLIGIFAIVAAAAGMWFTITYFLGNVLDVLGWASETAYSLTGFVPDFLLPFVIFGILLAFLHLVVKLL